MVLPRRSGWSCWCGLSRWSTWSGRCGLSRSGLSGKAADYALIGRASVVAGFIWFSDIRGRLDRHLEGLPKPKFRFALRYHIDLVGVVDGDADMSVVEIVVLAGIGSIDKADDTDPSSDPTLVRPIR